MSRAFTLPAAFPSGAVFGRLTPEGPRPTPAEVFEGWGVDEDNPAELIGGWVLPIAPGDHETGQASGDLYAELRAFLKTKG